MRVSPQNVWVLLVKFIHGTSFLFDQEQRLFYADDVASLTVDFVSDIT
jgi:hypothetical protein